MKGIDILFVFLGSMLLCGAGAQAETPVEAGLTKRVQFDIAAQPLPAALAKFAAQTGIEFSASTDLVEGKHGSEVKGELTTDEGLRALLKGTGLEFTATQGGVVAIRASPNTAAVVEEAEDEL